MLNLAVSWIVMPTPLWVSLLLAVACAALAWQLFVAVKRIDRHAQSIAHMDEWADSVDQTLAQIEERARRFLPAQTAAPRSAVDLKKWWQKE